MNKRLLWALLLIAVSVIVLIFNAGGKVSIAVLPGVDVSMLKSIAFLLFVATGVVIGVLLK